MRAEELPFDVALKAAQDLGYAEADPHNDVSGEDAFRKLMILCALAFGEQPDWNKVEVVGIDGISSEQVEEAKAQGLRYRHVADAYRDEATGEIIAKVGPQLVGADHPLYAIDDVNNAVTLDTNYIGTLTMVGPGAGMYPTASVMMEDYADMLAKPEKAVSLAYNKKACERVCRITISHAFLIFIFNINVLWNRRCLPNVDFMF